MSITEALIVDYLRAFGPCTGPAVCAACGLSYGAAAKALMNARYDKLIAIRGKTENGALIYGAVQTIDWPGQGEGGRAA